MHHSQTKERVGFHPHLLKLSKGEGFTLLELLIVIAILAILSGVTLIVLNPSELLKRTRDSRRLSDLATINRALGYYQTEGGTQMGSSSVVYVSLPDTSPTCGSYTLPPLPSGWSYKCVTSQSLRKVDGTGWIPVNFSSLSIKAPFSAIPIDPVNTAATGSQYYFTYVTGGSWNLTALFESSHEPIIKQAINDGGAMPGVFELGTNTKLGPFTRDKGLVGFWRFEEGTGTSTADSSGNGNTGTLTNGPTWQTESSCKVGKCLSFDGVNDYVNNGNGSSLDIRNATIMAWLKLSSLNRNNSAILEKTQIYRFGLDGSTTTPQIWWSWQNADSQWQGLEAGSIVASGTWHYLVGVYDGNTSKVYLDGFLDGSVVSGSSPIKSAPGTNVYIDYRDGWNTITGLIDEVRIYNRALSADEIAAIYSATK